MGLKYIAFFAAITLVSFSLSESKWVGSSQNSNSVNLNSLLDNPKIRDGILQTILQNRGTSVEQIQEIIEAADGNIVQAVSGINTEINLDLLVLDGDVIRINPSALKTLVKETFQASIKQRLPNKPDWASSLQNSVDQEIEAGSPEFDNAVEQSVIPVSVAQEQLVESRKRRSVQPREGFDLAQIISDLVTSVLRNQLGGLLNGLLDNLKNTVSGLLIVTPPGNAVGDFLAGVVNFAVKSLLQIITTIQQTVIGVLPTEPETDGAARRKRDILDIVPYEGEIENTNGGLLDVIVRPVLTLLANVLTPVHNFVLNLANNIFGVLEGVLGTLLTTRIQAVTVALINLLIPSNPI